MQIGGGKGTYSSTKSGSNLVVTVGKGKITLVGASTANIDGKAPDTNSWKLDGTTATYGTTSKTLVTVKGVTSTSGLNLSNKVITVSKAALGTANVSITGGTGYTLKFGDDVSQSATTTESWSMKNSTTAVRKQTKSAYYTLASNSKSISYKKSTSSDLTTIIGVKATSGLSISGKVVTVGNASLNKSAVTITNGYTLKLGSNVTQSKTTKAGWSLNTSTSTATYKSAKKTTGYTLSDNKISYVTASGGSTLATVKGVKSKPTLSGKIITLTTSNIGAAKKVSVSGNYAFNFAAGDYENASVTGTANADTIKVLGTNAIVTGGKGNDSLVSNSSGGNVFVYSSGDGNDIITNFAANDKLSIKSAATYTTNGSDVVFSVGEGSITLKDAKDKTFTYSDNDGEKEYNPSATTDPYIISDKGITLTSAYTEKKFSVSTVSGGSKLVTIDASAVTHELEVKGNAKANKIIASDAGGTLDGGSGKVSDTLIGGKGKDVFVYYSGDGNDVISGYESNDTIKIAEGTVSTIYPSRENVVFKVGNGKITVQDAKETRITYIENGIEYGCVDGKKTFTIGTNSNTVIASLSSSYWKDTFDVTTFGNEDVGNSIQRIYASKVTHELNITGNDSANEIFAGRGGGTIIGGKGDDSLYGDDGANIYVYKNGDGNDHIFNYGEDDVIRITTSGRVPITTSGDNVIFSVGEGKITFHDAIDKEINYVINGKTERFSNPDVDDAWFLDDEDNYIGADNQLSSIVRDGKASYSLLQTENSLTLTAKNDSLPALTYSAKK